MQNLPATPVPHCSSHSSAYYFSLCPWIGSLCFSRGMSAQECDALTQHTTTMETLSGVKSEALLSLMFAALQASAPAHCLSPVPRPWGDRGDLWAQKCDAHLCHGMEKMAAAKFSVPLGQLWLFPRQYCCPASVTASLPILSPSLDFSKLGVSLQF